MTNFIIITVLITSLFSQKIFGQEANVRNSTECSKQTNETFKNKIVGKWTFTSNKDSEGNEINFKGVLYFHFKKNGKFKFTKDNEVFKGKWFINNCSNNNLILESKRRLVTKKERNKLKSYGVGTTLKLNKLLYTISEIDDNKLVTILLEDDLSSGDFKQTIYEKH